jgi:cytochrome c-type biogenesis protein
VVIGSVSLSPVKTTGYCATSIAYSGDEPLAVLLLGLGVDQVSGLLKKLKPHLGKIEVGTGLVMILVGVMIYFN